MAMHLQWALALAMLVLAVARHRPLPTHRCGPDVTVAHTACLLVMIAMLAGALTAASASWLALAFLVPALWFGRRAAVSFVLSGTGAAAACDAAGCAVMACMLIAV